MLRPAEYDVREAFRAIARRRAIVTTTTLTFVALALVLNQVTHPVFRTSVRLAIHATPSRSALTGVMIESPTLTSENLTLLTTAERITNREVLEQVAIELRADRRQLRPDPVRFTAGWGAPPVVAEGLTTAALPLRDDIELLLRTVNADDPLLPQFTGAQLIVRVSAEAIFPNCPRYVHKLQLVEESVYTPRPEHTAPVPQWKLRPEFREVLPGGRHESGSRDEA